MTSLKTGGIRPLYITFRAELLGADGRTLEEISTTVKETRGRHEWGLFQNRLANAARAGGANVAEYLMKRAGLD